MGRVEGLKLSRYKDYWSLESQRMDIVTGGPFCMDIENSFTYSLNLLSKYLSNNFSLLGTVVVVLYCTK